MNPKNQLDNNEGEKNHLEGGKEFHNSEVVGDLDALKTEVRINTIHNEETQIEQISDEVNAIKESVLQNKKIIKSEYVPINNTSEKEMIERANAGRSAAEKNIKENMQKYPGFLGRLITTIDKLSQ